MVSLDLRWTHLCETSPAISILFKSSVKSFSTYNSVKSKYKYSLIANYNILFYKIAEWGSGAQSYTRLIDVLNFAIDLNFLMFSGND